MKDDVGTISDLARWIYLGNITLMKNFIVLAWTVIEERKLDQSPDRKAKVAGYFSF